MAVQIVYVLGGNDRGAPGVGHEGNIATPADQSLRFLKYSPKGRETKRLQPWARRLGIEKGCGNEALLVNNERGTERGGAGEQFQNANRLGKRPEIPVSLHL